MLRYSGRDFTDGDLAVIRLLIESRPDLNRNQLSMEICNRFDWRKVNGGLKDMSCRVALLGMHRAGLITLPAPRCERPQQGGKIQATAATDCPESVPTIDDLKSIEVTLVKASTKTSHLWNEFIHRYHYLGFKTLPGTQLRYFITYQGNPIAMLGFGAAAWKTMPRDNYIGWDAVTRERRLHLIVNNARFLILPWIRRKNLASKILSIAIKRLPQDWENHYSYRPLLLETFVDDTRFTGATYKASNWICVGKTKGRGRFDTKKECKVPVKQVWLFPLVKNAGVTLRTDCVPLKQPP